jgi:hypothetical protein
VDLVTMSHDDMAWSVALALPDTFDTIDVDVGARRDGLIGVALLRGLAEDGLPVEADLLMYCLQGSDAVDPIALEDVAASMRTSPHVAGHRQTTLSELNGRPAVRFAGFEVVDPEVALSPTVAVRRYVIPVPGSGMQFVLSCATPHLDASEEMGELFDAIAEGITIT